jgi:hypothetical protein
MLRRTCSFCHDDLRLLPFLKYCAASLLGDKRLDGLLKYKCLYDMKSRMKAQNGGKVSAVFGRSYFKISKSWQLIKASIALPPLVYSEMFDYFIRHFESSLLLDDNNSLDVMSDSSLVWAVDFYGALKQRQDKRKVEAKKRIASDEKKAVRDAEESDREDSDDEDYKNKKSGSDSSRGIVNSESTEKENTDLDDTEHLKGSSCQKDYDLD